MKKKIIGLLIVISATLIGCVKYETEDPTCESFKVYELVTRNGVIETGNEIAAPKAGTTYRLQVISQSDVAVFWPGDFKYLPLGSTKKDSIIDSRNYYRHYGQTGAQGLTTNALRGRIGWFRDYAWPNPGNYDVAVVLTNHAADGPDFKQKVFDYKVTVGNR
ncbi:MAG: hypothetical protein ACRCVT_08155 [Leadbetterella sp.]